MTYINESDRSAIINIIQKHIPNKIDNILHINPYSEMNNLIIQLIESNVLPLDKKPIELVCKEWKTLLYKKFSLLN
jgi:hypothetical protein